MFLGWAGNQGQEEAASIKASGGAEQSKVLPALQ